MKRPESHLLTFAPGDRILWDQRTLRLYYEQQNGYRGVLTLQGTAKNEKGSTVSTELPGPTTLEQARTQVCIIAVLASKALDESMDHGMTVWQFTERSPTSRPSRV